MTKGGPGTMTETISIYAYIRAFKEFETSYAGAIAFLVIILLSIIVMIRAEARGDRPMTVSDTSAPQPASRWPRWLTRERRRMAWRFLIALVVLVFFLFPVYWLFITSIKSAGRHLRPPAGLVPGAAELSHTFGVLFKDGDVWAIYNSLIIASVSTVVAMVLGTAAAYSLARFKTGGQNLAIWIISQRMIPPIVIVFPVFLLFV